MSDLNFGLMLMLFGMGLVFLILALLWGVIAIFQQIDRRVLAKEDEKPRRAAATAAPPAPDLPSALIAAILVALDRYQQEAAGQIEPARGPSIQVASGQPRWVAVGRSYQLRSNIVPPRRRQR